jgi:hypothetical protein
MLLVYATTFFVRHLKPLSSMMSPHKIILDNKTRFV